MIDRRCRRDIVLARDRVRGTVDLASVVGIAP
jgi:hypothetical protein